MNDELETTEIVSPIIQTNDYMFDAFRITVSASSELTINLDTMPRYIALSVLSASGIEVCFYASFTEGKSFFIDHANLRSYPSNKAMAISFRNASVFPVIVVYALLNEKLN